MKLTSFFIFFTLIFSQPFVFATVPTVSPTELSERAELLKQRAEEFKKAQLERVKVISERIISFMPKEDQTQLRKLTYEISPSDEVNAHVMKSHMTVYYGLLRFAESDHELAAVIGHELAHIVKGHYKRSIGINKAAEKAAIMEMKKTPFITTKSDEQRGLEAYLKTRGKFKREAEREADYFGLKYIYLSGFDLMEGINFWERMAVERSSNLDTNLLSTHPPSPERLLRGEKIMEMMSAQGLEPYSLFESSGLQAPSSKKNMDRRRRAAVMKEEAEEMELLKAEIDKLSKEINERDDEFYQTHLRSADIERALAAARESSRKLRYAEFGIKEMGLAKDVKNFLVGKTVEGQVNIFPIKQGSVDWFAQYDYWSSGSFKALAMQHRKYHVKWYSPNGRVYSEKDFMQSKVRGEFAKTTLEWDVELGDYLVGRWLVRVYEDGQLLDERGFEIVRT